MSIMANSKKIAPQDVLLKVILVGDSGVGKTNMLNCFCEGSFRENYVATIGVDFKIKAVTVGERRVKLQIWDTAGQQRFRNITQTYYRSAAGIILVYSITDATSFSNVAGWLKQIEANATEGVSRLLVGAKNDLNQQRQVTLEEGKSLAKKHSMDFFQVSAKTKQNVQQCFMSITSEIIKRKPELQTPIESIKIIDTELKPKNHCLC